MAALGLCAALAGCGRDRPLHKGADASLPQPIDSAAPDLTPAPPRCDRPGDPCCPNAGVPMCSDGLVCDPTSQQCVACGDATQPCCARGCNLGLACDHSVSSTVFGLCTTRCGLLEQACCARGECEEGSACTTQDETGTCRACGVPGLKCCRADCWIGVCMVTDAARVCVACGVKGQPCCEGGGSEVMGCSDGTACDKAPGDLRGVCAATCGFEGKPCCRGGGCQKPFTCTNPDPTGICAR